MHIQIGEMFDRLASEGFPIEDRNGYEVIFPNGYEIHTAGNRFVRLVGISRHKTTKEIFKFTVKGGDGPEKTIEVTSDHVMMTYDKDHFFENRRAKDVSVGDYVSVYDEKADSEMRGTVAGIEKMGRTDEYVYDCEVDDGMHSFYLNDIKR